MSKAIVRIEFGRDANAVIWACASRLVSYDDARWACIKWLLLSTLKTSTKVTLPSLPPGLRPSDVMNLIGL